MIPTSIPQDWSKVDLAIERVSSFPEMDQFLERAPKVFAKHSELAEQLAVVSPERTANLQHNIREVQALRTLLAQAFQGVPERVAELRQEYRQLRFRSLKLRWSRLVETGKALLLAPLHLALWIGHRLRSPFRESSPLPPEDCEPPTRTGVG